MEIELSQRQIDAIAYKCALIIAKKLKETEVIPEMVTTSEAARILKVTPATMRRIADRYPHIKQGDSKQSKLLFYSKNLVP